MNNEADRTNLDQPETDIDWSKVELSDDNQDDTPAEPVPYNGRDQLLHYFNQLTLNGFSLGITLFVNGLTLSGKMISGREYIKDLMVPYDGFEKNTWANHIHSALNEVLEFDDTARQKPDYGNELNFIHLKNAKAFTPGNNKGLPANGSLMRIKVDTIDGWSHGVLEEAAPDA